MASDVRSDRLFHKSVTLNKITCECPIRLNLLFTIQDGRRQYEANFLPTNPKKREARREIAEEESASGKISTHGLRASG